MVVTPKGHQQRLVKEPGLSTCPSDVGHPLRAQPLAVGDDWVSLHKKTDQGLLGFLLFLHFGGAGCCGLGWDQAFLPTGGGRQVGGCSRLVGVIDRVPAHSRHTGA